MKIAHRLQLILLVALAGIVISIVTGLSGLKRQMLADRETKTRHIVEVAHGMISHYADLAKQGRLSEEDAKAAAKAAIKSIRYEGVEYLWINDRGRPVPTMIMHPTVPALEGKVLTQPSFDKATSARAAGEAEATPLAGKNIFVAFNDVVAKAGEGVVIYSWPKPKQGGGTTEELFTKLSYVKGAPWGWIVGSGIYIDDVDAAFTKAAYAQAVPALLIALLVAAIALWMARAILRPLGRLTATIGDIERTGDLSLRVDVRGNDEVGRAAGALNNFLGNLEPVLEDLKKVMAGVVRNDLSGRVRADAQSRLVADIKNSVNASLESLSTTMRNVIRDVRQVAVATGETSVAIGQIADGAAGQINAIKQITVGITQTARAVEDVASGAKQSSDHARQAAALVDEGRTRIAGMVDVVEQIAANAAEIGKITQVIGQIARGTDMLSLNAAIEATRAGDAGSGFAVVASEVGKLAEVSGRSAADIRILIDKATAESERGVGLARGVGESVDRIAAGAVESERMAGSIAHAVHQQSSAVEQIRASVDQLSRIGETNAAAAEEVGATMVELAELAGRTRADVERFTF